MIKTDPHSLLWKEERNSIYYASLRLGTGPGTHLSIISEPAAAQGQAHGPHLVAA